jgi:hypothetical protein
MSVNASKNQQNKKNGDSVKLLGVELRKPTFDEITSTTFTATMALAVILLLCAAVGVQMSRGNVVAIFVYALWSGLAVDLGFRRDTGWRYLVVVFVGAIVIDVVVHTLFIALS